MRLGWAWLFVTHSVAAAPRLPLQWGHGHARWDQQQWAVALQNQERPIALTLPYGQVDRHFLTLLCISLCHNTKKPAVTVSEVLVLFS